MKYSGAKRTVYRTVVFLVAEKILNHKWENRPKKAYKNLVAFEKRTRKPNKHLGKANEDLGKAHNFLVLFVRFYLTKAYMFGKAYKKSVQRFRKSVQRLRKTTHFFVRFRNPNKKSEQGFYHYTYWLVFFCDQKNHGPDNEIQSAVNPSDPLH